ncbi:MAG: hypothetical protein ABSD21_11225 [Rhizomicrobium sp.]
MKRLLFSALAIAATAAFSGNALAASSVANMNTTLSAMPRAFRGVCPAVITFTGTITVKGTFDPQYPVQIGYQFLRSDNAIGPISYYTIAASGTQTVSDTWTLGGAALPNYSGWQQLKAWPTEHLGFGYSFSPRAKFTVVCRR